ncbi:hypothetical protein ACHAWO_007450 [Cyclotella atomus]|uniref:Uncharacterized protein n=1 Tax=Cyclotella atomus TaxID=382360 RepID=A0ABD3NXB3_9STRA
MKVSSMPSSLAAAALVVLVCTINLVAGEELRALRGRYKQSENHNLKLRQSNPLSGGDCEWTQPSAVPEDLDLWKTLLVGFPSGDKRLVYLQMEAMTGFLARDDWDFYFNGLSNSPFIKTNYPQSSGVWSFDKSADQVVLVVQNIRRAMAEYSEVMAKINFSRFNDNKEEFFAWRDHNLLIELYKYGWQIDFWMEGGLYRDPYTHSALDQAAFEHYHQPEAPPLHDTGYITFAAVCLARPTRDKVSTSVIRVNCCPPSCSQSRWLFEHCLAARF